jgi:hypothetical protein
MNTMSEELGAFDSRHKLTSFAPPSGGQVGGPRPDPPYRRHSAPQVHAFVILALAFGRT